MLTYHKTNEKENALSRNGNIPVNMVYNSGTV